MPACDLIWFAAGLYGDKLKGSIRPEGDRSEVFFKIHFVIWEAG